MRKMAVVRKTVVMKAVKKGLHQDTAESRREKSNEREHTNTPTTTPPSDWNVATPTEDSGACKT